MLRNQYLQIHEYKCKVLGILFETDKLFLTILSWEKIPCPGTYSDI